MKKIACLLVSAFLMSSPIVFAQGEMDAYKLSQFGLNGTARYLGMGGAFGALGGDVTSMTTNPAGLSIYRSSEVVTTLSLNSMNAKTDLNGVKTDANKTKANFDNIAYVAYFPTGNDAGIKSWNVGFAYNRLKNFDRKVKMSGRQEYSIAEYFADKAFGIKEKDLQYIKGVYDPYDNPNIPYLPILGYETGFFETFPGKDNDYHSTFGEYSGGKWLNYSPDQSEMELNERGSTNQYNFSFSTNVSDFLFLGATMSVTDINYRLFSRYAEDFAQDYLYLENSLESNGTGYAVNVGAIVRPADFLRLGLAYNSPTWYNMTDYYYGYGETEINKDLVTNETPEGDAYDYKLRTPDRWIFSAAGIIGKNALVSVDYELTNYKNTNLTDRNDRDLESNKWIKQDFGVSGTLKIGTEIKVTPQFAVRAGGAFQSSPIKAHIKDGLEEVVTSGTIPHYTVDKGSSSFSVGFGYRFTPNFYTDIACVYHMQKDDLYAFSNTFISDTDRTKVISSDPISLKTNTTRVALTLGYKF